MILEHYHREPVIWTPKDYKQSYEKPGWGWPMKPDGLWVSVKGDDDWPSWCRDEDFRLDHLTHRHIVTLHDDAAIKIISGEKQLLEFDREWGAEWDLGGHSFHRIDWPRLADQWDGIIIAPYVWSCRLPMELGSARKSVSDWYYPWDCASGCIWNGEAIKSVELAEVIPLEELEEKAA